MCVCLALNVSVNGLRGLIAGLERVRSGEIHFFPRWDKRDNIGI